MTRRIIYILLAIVVVLVVVLGIRWWLNRGGDTVVDEVGDEIGEVVDEATSGTPVIDIGTEGDTTETAPVDTATTPEANMTDETAVATEATPVAGEGETAPATGTDTSADTGTADTGTTEATAPEGSTDGSSGEAIAADSSLGGVPDSGDANVGGGMVEPGLADTSAATDSSSSEATAPSTTESTDTSAANGTGGQSAQLPQISLVVPGQPIQHMVQNKEWLTQLARCYGTTVQDIQAANNYACPDLIQPGWVVNINNPGNAGPITINEMPCFTYYTVQQGDNLYRIAEQFGINYQWLARINAVYNYDYVQVGQILVIPNPVPPEMTTAPAQPFYYSPCWGYGCGYDGYWQPQPVPYGW
ncbi:MAG: LysM peptidoglycan-binding domain-containing protein [Ardenticatenaceae bacterium]|nr:LysM peptidoglycan-binding domain-containing protein [Ardenticatenaceae bacterium]MCB8988444.1 LysM peptidoglycan-binding domain-containing protein [Ardenticatenaceae bacterium]